MVKLQTKILVKGDISPFEQEALYNYCSNIFTLLNWDNEQLDYNDEHVTDISFFINSDFSSEFFENINEKNWNELLSLLKDIRKRRGSHSVHVHLIFNGSNSNINIHCTSSDKECFNQSLDTIKFILIGTALVSNNNSIQEQHYVFDKKKMLWVSH